MKSKFKVYYYYHNINLWNNLSIDNLKKKKWQLLQQKCFKLPSNKLASIGIYICHYKKLNVSKLYYFKFINKQILRKYLVNYSENTFKTAVITNYYNLERRLDFNLYKAHFVTSLYEARFVITKGFILVNKNVVFNYNYLLNTNDIVEVKPFLYNYILKNINFNDLNKFKYLRNLQIDYKTFSFIFLNKLDYFILNYNNFIKKIYYKQNFNNTNSILINNNYNFLINLFKNYISLNRSTKVNLNKINYLLKFIKYKYNDYYFRNILLKQTFKIKYLYLKNLLQYTQNFNFENIDNIFTSLFEINNFEKISNSLNNSFFNYYYNLIFNFYIFTLKYNNFNYKMVDKTMLFLNLVNNNKVSINTYNYLLILISKYFKLLHIKNKLTHFYQVNNTNNNIIKFQNNSMTFNTIIKRIDYKKISQNYTYKCHYNSIYFYKRLILYVSSYKFGYKLYRRCRNFQQNNIKRANIIKRIRKSFNYTRFNCNRYGIYMKRISKTNLYNKLILASLNISNKNNKGFKITNFYPMQTKVSLQTYLPVLTTNINKIKKLEYSIKNNNNLKQYLNSIEKQLKFKSKILKLSNVNNKYNNNVCSLYLLIDSIYKNNSDINFKVLTNFSTLITYTIYELKHLNLKQISTNNLNKKYYIKHYKRFGNDYRRYQINPYHILINKTRTLMPTNLKYYFIKEQNLVGSKVIKLFFNYYFCLVNNMKYSLFVKANIKVNRSNKYIFNKSKYFNKRIYFNLISHNNSIKRFNTNVISNLNLIEKTDFNDRIFFIDLILNLTSRKFNINYNDIYYSNYKSNCNNLNITTLLNYKKLNYKKLIKKYNNKYYLYNQYLVQTYNNYFITKKISTNKVKYFYNQNSVNNIINQNLFKIYYGYLIHNSAKLFIKFKNNKQYINNIYKIYSYYVINLKKYNIIKYLYKNYIFKEYNCFLNKLLTSINSVQIDKTYIKQLLYNLIFNKLYNNTDFDILLQNNYFYSRNLKIIINYFILINRFYK